MNDPLILRKEGTTTLISILPNTKLEGRGVGNVSNWLLYLYFFQPFINILGLKLTFNKSQIKTTTYIFINLQFLPIVLTLVVTLDHYSLDQNRIDLHSRWQNPKYSLPDPLMEVYLLHCILPSLN